MARRTCSGYGEVNLFYGQRGCYYGSGAASNKVKVKKIPRYVAGLPCAFLNFIPDKFWRSKVRQAHPIPAP